MTKRLYTFLFILSFLMLIRTLSYSQCNLITVQPQDEYTFDNGQSVFWLTAQGSNLTYQWEELFVGATNWQIINSINSNVFATLSVTLADHGKQYRCIVNDGTCNDTSVVATLFVSPPDTMRTYIGSPFYNSGTSSSGCGADTLFVPVFIDGGGVNNNIGAISMKIEYDSDHLELWGDSTTTNNIALHYIDSTLAHDGNFSTTIQPHPTQSSKSILSIAWYHTGNYTTLFPQTRAAFTLAFKTDSIPNNFTSVTEFYQPNNATGYNEYGDANTGYPLVDDGFVEADSLFIWITSCAENVNGVINYGIFPNNPVYGNNVSVSLLDNNNSLVPVANNPQIVNSSGFSFENVPAGQYKVALQDFAVDDNGAINSTDALRVMLNFLGLLPLTPLELRAAETDGVNANGVPNGSDAFQIARYFVDEISQFDDLSGTLSPFPIWEQDTMNAIVSFVDLNGEIKAILRGDVNGNFDVSNLHGGKVSEISLQLQDKIEINKSHQSIEIPFKTTTALKVGAISMVVDFPFDILKIENIQLNPKVNSQNLLYSINEGRIRMSWFHVMPLTLEMGEPLFTISATTLDDLNTFWQPTITRGNESELANDMGEVLEDITLTIPELVLNIPIEQPEIITYQIFPNPTSDKAFLNIASKENGQLKVLIYNSLGILIQEMTTQNISKGRSSIELPLKNLPTGQYHIHLLFENDDYSHQATERMIIQD